MELQDTVRRRSGPDDQEIIEEKRDALVAMFVQLKDLQIAAGITESAALPMPVLDDETEYDEHDEMISTETDSEIVPVERKIIVIPSNGNVVTNATDLEIRFRTRQAETQLNRLRDIIADISFQYSHVIRGQIRKDVRTRSQKRIKSLHHKLSLHARIYTRCRNHLVALNCGQSILNLYRVLKKEDLKTSTAILDPNLPGSTTLKLSWIWHSGSWLLMNDDAAAVASSYSGAASAAGPDGAPEFDPAPVSNPAAASVITPSADPLSLNECMYFFFR